MTQKILAALIAGLIVIGTPASCVYFFILSGTRCDTWESVLSNQQKDHTVMLIEEGCSGFDNEVTMTIALATPNGHKTTVFVWGDASSYVAFQGRTAPAVDWPAPNRLRISIGAIADIQKQVDKVADITIEYDIGHVIYPQPQSTSR